MAGMIKPEIVYEDKELMLVYKPAGLATQSGKVGQKDLVSELRRLKGGAECFLIHRLDQPVEGLLAVAMTKSAAGKISSQLSSGSKSESLGKEYLAVVYGNFEEKSGEIINYLLKTKENVAQIVDANCSEAKRAVLKYNVLEEREGVSLLKVVIETGRFHQIRCQLSSIGHPILGDQKYGSQTSKAFTDNLITELVAEGKIAPADAKINVALCANSISVVSPVNGKLVQFEVKPENVIFKAFEK